MYRVIIKSKSVGKKKKKTSLQRIIMIAVLPIMFWEGREAEYWHGSS